MSAALLHALICVAAHGSWATDACATENCPRLDDSKLLQVRALDNDRPARAGEISSQFATARSTATTTPAPAASTIESTTTGMPSTSMTGTTSTLQDVSATSGMGPSCAPMGSDVYDPDMEYSVPLPAPCCDDAAPKNVGGAMLCPSSCGKPGWDVYDARLYHSGESIPVQCCDDSTHIVEGGRLVCPQGTSHNEDTTAAEAVAISMAAAGISSTTAPASVTDTTTTSTTSVSQTITASTTGPRCAPAGADVYDPDMEYSVPLPAPCCDNEAPKSVGGTMRCPSSCAQPEWDVYDPRLYHGNTAIPVPCCDDSAHIVKRGKLICPESQLGDASDSATVAAASAAAKTTVTASTSVGPITTDTPTTTTGTSSSSHTSTSSPSTSALESVSSALALSIREMVPGVNPKETQACALPGVDVYDPTMSFAVPLPAPCCDRQSAKNVRGKMRCPSTCAQSGWDVYDSALYQDNARLPAACCDNSMAVLSSGRMVCPAGTTSSSPPVVNATSAAVNTPTSNPASAADSGAIDGPVCAPPGADVYDPGMFYAVQLPAPCCDDKPAKNVRGRMRCPSGCAQEGWDVFDPVLYDDGAELPAACCDRSIAIAESGRMVCPASTRTRASSSTTDPAPPADPSMPPVESQAPPEASDSNGNTASEGPLCARPGEDTYDPDIFYSVQLPVPCCDAVSAKNVDGTMRCPSSCAKPGWDVYDTRLYHDSESVPVLCCDNSKPVLDGIKKRCPAGQLPNDIVLGLERLSIEASGRSKRNTKKPGEMSLLSDDMTSSATPSAAESTSIAATETTTAIATTTEAEMTATDTTTAISTSTEAEMTATDTTTTISTSTEAEMIATDTTTATTTTSTSEGSTYPAATQTDQPEPNAELMVSTATTTTLNITGLGSGPNCADGGADVYDPDMNYSVKLPAPCCDSEAPNNVDGTMRCPHECGEPGWDIHDSRLYLGYLSLPAPCCDESPPIKAGGKMRCPSYCAQAGWDVFDSNLYHGYLLLPAPCCDDSTPDVKNGRFICPSGTDAGTDTSTPVASAKAEATSDNKSDPKKRPACAPTGADVYDPGMGYSVPLPAPCCDKQLPKNVGGTMRCIATCAKPGWDVYDPRLYDSLLNTPAPCCDGSTTIVDNGKLVCPEGGTLSLSTAEAATSTTISGRYLES